MTHATSKYIIEFTGFSKILTVSEIKTDLPIRDDLHEAFRAYWVWLAKPGNWWSGAERVAIAAEVRNALNCKLCAERKLALSPSAVQGTHEPVGNLLPNPVIEAVHQLVTDATRLTESWIRENFSDELTDGHYVELLGVTVLLISIDQFHRALGIPLETLPTPEPGEPSGYRPPGAESGVGWVPMLRGDNVSQNEADIFSEGMTSNILRAMSLVPDCVRQLKNIASAQYLPITKLVDVTADTGRALERPQMELIAARVSAINECFY